MPSKPKDKPVPCPVCGEPFEVRKCGVRQYDAWHVGNGHNLAIWGASRASVIRRLRAAFGGRK